MQNDYEQTGDYGMQGNKSSAMREGKVKKWFEDKGFGFITSQGKDYFVHVTKLADGTERLAPEQEVEFYTVDTPKGVQAIDVSIVNMVQ